MGLRSACSLMATRGPNDACPLPWQPLRVVRLGLRECRALVAKASWILPSIPDAARAAQDCLLHG